MSDIILTVATWVHYSCSMPFDNRIILQPDSWSPVSEGFVGDPWLSITLTLCHILHSVSHWPVLVYLINRIISTGSLGSSSLCHNRPARACFQKILQ
jgi:hypothetical protein